MHTATPARSFQAQPQLLLWGKWAIGLGWLEKLRRLWERRFDRLEDYLRKLQQKERPNGRKK